MASIKYTLYFDGCDTTVIDRFKSIFDYVEGDNSFKGYYQIINVLFGTTHSEENHPDQEWINNNVGVSTLNGKIEFIDIDTDTVSLTIVSPNECIPFIQSLIQDINLNYKDDVRISGDYESFTFETCGVIVGGDNREVVKHVFDMTNYDVSEMVENSQALINWGSDLFDFRSLKYSEFLAS